ANWRTVSRHSAPAATLGADVSAACTSAPAAAKIPASTHAQTPADIPGTRTALRLCIPFSRLTACGLSYIPPQSLWGSKNMALPPGVDASTFANVLRQFKDAVGSDWVFEGDDAALYRDAYSPLWGEPEERVASAAVAPADVE